MHPIDHVIQGGDRFECILAGQGGVGRGLEGRKDVLGISFDVLLDGLEVLAREFVREAEEGLVLSVRLRQPSDVESIGGIIPGAGGFRR